MYQLVFNCIITNFEKKEAPLHFIGNQNSVLLVTFCNQIKEKMLAFILFLNVNT